MELKETKWLLANLRLSWVVFSYVISEQEGAGFRIWLEVYFLKVCLMLLLEPYLTTEK